MDDQHQNNKPDLPTPPDSDKHAGESDDRVQKTWQRIFGAIERMAFIVARFIKEYPIVAAIAVLVGLMLSWTLDTVTDVVYERSEKLEIVINGPIALEHYAALECYGSYLRSLEAGFTLDALDQENMVQDSALVKQGVTRMLPELRKEYGPEAIQQAFSDALSQADIVVNEATQENVKERDLSVGERCFSQELVNLIERVKVSERERKESEAREAEARRLSDKKIRKAQLESEEESRLRAEEERKRRDEEKEALRQQRESEEARIGQQLFRSYCGMVYLVEVANKAKGRIPEEKYNGLRQRVNQLQQSYGEAQQQLMLLKPEQAEKRAEILKAKADQTARMLLKEHGTKLRLDVPRGCVEVQAVVAPAAQ